MTDTAIPASKLTENQLLQQICRSGHSLGPNAFEAVVELHKRSDLPFNEFLERLYSNSAEDVVRHAAINYIFRFARFPTTVELALKATTDRSKEVRRNAFYLLACSQRSELIPKLESIAQAARDDQTHADAVAAIDAIKNQNHNFYIDRAHTGAVNAVFKFIDPDAP